MIMTALNIISRYSRTYFERRLSDINLGFTEFSILMYIIKVDTSNQEQIAKHFLLDKGAVAKALNKLEKKKFITRTDNPNNKREKLITMTEQGKSIINLLNAQLQEWHNYLFEGLNKSDIDAYIQTTLKIAENAAKIINERKAENDDKE